MGPKKYVLGGKEVSKATYYRRRSQSSSDASSEDAAGPSQLEPIPLLVPSSSSTSSSTSSSDASMGFPMLGGEENSAHIEPTNSPPIPFDEFQVYNVDKWAGIGFIDGRIPPRISVSMDLAKAIENKVVSFQGLLDDSNVPITVQGKILEQLFAKNLENQQDPENYDEMGLRQLFALAESQSVEYFDPPTWDKLEGFYKTEGMISPVRYRLCTGVRGNPHVPILLEPNDKDIYEGAKTIKCSCNERNKTLLKRDCPSCSQKCPTCLKLRKLTLAFDYLPFGPRIAKMCESRTSCYEFLELWRNRTDWMHKSVDYKPPSITQFWHGRKMRELQNFWNPHVQWELPIYCSSPICQCVFKAFPTKCAELLEGWNEQLQIYQIKCSCGNITEIAPSFAQGDPRNFAIAAHWDGFLPATTKYKDSWAVEIELLNAGMQYLMRPMPVVFIPASSEKIVKEFEEGVLTVFLEPFLRELESIFVHGFPVKYNYPLDIIDYNMPNVEPLILRAMLMYWTGDHPAQCKVGGFKSSGYQACRRCHLPGKILQGRGSVMYPNNRYEIHYPHERRTIENILVEAKDVANLAPSNRSRRSHNIISFSKLWRLYFLYGFDLSLDLVYDAMHILPLNLFKSFVDLLVQKGLAREMDVALREITIHRPKQLGSRWPSGMENRLAFWKAEEYQLFIMWCLPYCIDKVQISNTDRLYKISQILFEIARLYFTHTRTYGWTKESIDTARTLLSTWRIEWEEYNGPTGSILHHVAGNGEMVDDVLRHGPHDLYWCYRFERSVSSYKSIKTNQKLSEVTYCKYEARISYRIARESISKENDNLYPPQKAVEEIHKHLLTIHFCPGLQTPPNVHVCNEAHNKGIIISHSRLKASKLEKLKELLPPCYCKDVLENKGISVTKKQCIDYQPLNSIEEYLCKYWTREGLLNEDTSNQFHKHIEKVTFVIFRGTGYEVGDNVVARTDGTELHSLNELDHWAYKVKITMLFIHEFMGHHRLFFHGRFYKQITNVNNNTTVQLSNFSSMCILDSKPTFSRADDCRPIHLILHKFMVQPIPGRTDVVVASEMTNLKVPMHLIQLGGIGYCPPWPQVHDIMYYWRDLATPHMVHICVIREVLLPQHLREDDSNMGTSSSEDLYCGQVMCSTLISTRNIERGEYKASRAQPFQCSWNSLVGHVLESGIATHHIRGQPTIWQGIVLHDSYERGLLHY